jgi:chromosome segregation ATPase
MENRYYFRALTLVWSLSIIIVLSACTDREEREALEQKAANLEQQLHTRDSAFNKVLTVIEQAEAQIKEIKNRENMVSVNSGKDMTESDRAVLIEDLALIDQLIKETNQKVANISERLEKSNIEVSAFKRKVKKLAEQLAQQETSISELKQTLAQKDLEIKDLNERVTGLTSENEQQAELISLQVDIIDKKEREINTAYYAIDTEDELIAKGLIAKEGGFLGLGKTRDLNDNVPITKLMEIDRTLVDQLEINGKKIEVVTEHPQDSYELVEEEGVVKYLKIQNPEEFWKISKFLVVSIKG